MRIFVLALVLSLAGIHAAAARCADDVKDFRTRIEHDIKVRPSPQVYAAAKIMRKFDEPDGVVDEVDCYNTLARAKHALHASPPEQKAQR